MHGACVKPTLPSVAGSKCGLHRKYRQGPGALLGGALAGTARGADPLLGGGLAGTARGVDPLLGGGLAGTARGPDPLLGGALAGVAAARTAGACLCLLQPWMLGVSH